MKIRTLVAEKQHSNQAVSGFGQSESPPNNSESFGKETPNGEHSAGSFTRTSTSSLYKRTHPATESGLETDVKADASLDKDVSVKSGGQGVTTKKKRGQRKRKDCNREAKEGSVAESDTLGSSFTSWKDTSTSDSRWLTREPCKVNHNKASYNWNRDDLMEIFDSVASSEPAMVFRHRMDSQKRARYRKLIRRHVDISTIRSRIDGHSIRCVKELFRDLLLLANNALVFYSKRTREYKTAACLKDLVMKKYWQHCSNKTTSALLPMRSMCDRPVKPRSARPRPSPRPHKDNISEKLPDANSVVPQTREEHKRPCRTESSMPSQSVLKSRKEVKVPAKSKGAVDGSISKSSHVKERKRIRQK